MKKSTQVVLSGVLFLTSFIGFAQISTRTGGATNVLANVPNTNTNVGIGTTNPTEKLQVVGNVKANIGIFAQNNPDGSTFASIQDRNNKCVALSVGNILPGYPTINEYRTLRYYDFPVSNLNTKSSVFFGIEDRNDFGRFRMTAETGGTGQLIMLNKTQTEVFKVYDDGNDNIFLQMAKPNSYVGIGTTTYIDGADTYKLSVKGKIRADEVKVYNTWADYVFAKNYQLKPLQEVESFIKENGHLPNVPSAIEIESGGLKLGEMSKIQQEKIEELTLYLIQQNKEIELLKNQVKTLLEVKR